MTKEIVNPEDIYPLLFNNEVERAFLDAKTGILGLLVSENEAFEAKLTEVEGKHLKMQKEKEKLKDELNKAKKEIEKSKEELDKMMTENINLKQKLAESELAQKTSGNKELVVVKDILKTIVTTMENMC